MRPNSLGLRPNNSKRRKNNATRSCVCVFAIEVVVRHCTALHFTARHIPNDLESGNGIKELNKLVGLEDQDKIDTEAIAQVNYKRMENIQLS